MSKVLETLAIAVGCHGDGITIMGNVEDATITALMSEISCYKKNSRTCAHPLCLTRKNKNKELLFGWQD